MIIVYTPRVNDKLSNKISSTEKYDCDAYRDKKEKKKAQLNKLLSEINRRNNDNSLIQQ